jgi:hypothetical protein
MRERWMVDRARNRLIVTTAMMQRLHDKLQFGLLHPAQVEAASALILAQLEQAVTLVDDASQSLRGASMATSLAPVRIQAGQDALAVSRRTTGGS